MYYVVQNVSEKILIPLEIKDFLKISVNKDWIDLFAHLMNYVSCLSHSLTPPMKWHYA